MMTTSTAAMTLFLSRKSVFGLLARIIGLLMLAALLQACSAIKLGYNNGPDLAYWWLDGYVDFTGEQSLRVKEDLSKLQSWHRRRELPEYTKLLQQAQALMPDDINAAQVCGMWALARSRLEPLVANAAPTVAQLAMSLQPKQVEALERKYAKTNADFRRDWLERSPEQVQSKRFDKALERAEMVYGRLDAPQRELLRQQMALTGLDVGTQYAERLRRQQDTLQTLRQWIARPPEPTQAVQASREALERMLRPSSPALQKAQTEVDDQMCNAVALLHNRTTSAQRQQGLRWLSGYERDMQELSAQK